MQQAMVCHLLFVGLTRKGEMWCIYSRVESGCMHWPFTCCYIDSDVFEIVSTIVAIVVVTVVFIKAPVLNTGDKSLQSNNLLV